MLRKAKHELVVHSLNENKHNPRHFWRILNEDLGLNSKKSVKGCTRLQRGPDDIITGTDVGNFLSEYYATNGKNLADKIPNVHIMDQDYYPGVRTKFNFYFIPLHIVERITKNVDICKSSGILNLSSELLRDALLCLNVEFTHLLNESISQEMFPAKWAVGNITPIPKEGDQLDPGNWRPITILPLPSKIMERAVHYQLVNYFEENNYLHSRQHGFRKTIVH